MDRLDGGVAGLRPRSFPPSHVCPLTDGCCRVDDAFRVAGPAPVCPAYRAGSVPVWLAHSLREQLWRVGRRIQLGGRRKLDVARLLRDSAMEWLRMVQRTHRSNCAGVPCSAAQKTRSTRPGLASGKSSCRNRWFPLRPSGGSLAGPTSGRFGHSRYDTAFKAAALNAILREDFRGLFSNRGGSCRPETTLGQ